MADSDYDEEYMLEPWNEWRNCHFRIFFQVFANVLSIDHMHTLNNHSGSTQSVVKILLLFC